MTYTAPTNVQQAGPPLILVVDDDASFLRSVGRLLHTAGYQVEAFDSPKVCLATPHPRLPQCLILDVHMPEMTGFELHAQLAAQGCCAPAVFMTAYDTPQTRERAKQAGGFGLLLKPFDQQPILAAISVALSVQASQSELGPPNGPA